MLKTLQFRELTIKEGVRFFLDSNTIVLNKEPVFFQELLKPEFDSHKVRHRCIFENGPNCSPTVYAYLTKNEISIIKCQNLPKEIYLFGSSQQTDVEQIRAFGRVKVAADYEVPRIMNLFDDRFYGGTLIRDNLQSRIDDKSKKDAQNALLSEGTLLIVEIISYSYHKNESE